MLSARQSAMSVSSVNSPGNQPRPPVISRPSAILRLHSAADSKLERGTERVGDGEAKQRAANGVGGVGLCHGRGIVSALGALRRPPRLHIHVEVWDKAEPATLAHHPSRRRRVGSSQRLGASRSSGALGQPRQSHHGHLPNPV